MTDLCVAIFQENGDCTELTSDRERKIRDPVCLMMTLLLLADEYQVSQFLQPCLAAVASQPHSTVEALLQYMPTLKNLSSSSLLVLLTGAVKSVPRVSTCSYCSRRF